MAPRNRDLLTVDMFEVVPVETAALPGALDFDRQVRHLLAEAMKQSPLSRVEIAVRMAELTGENITKNSLDAWAAESRDEWRFPLKFLPAFEAVCQTHSISGWLAGVRGCKLIRGKEAVDAEIGKLERMRQEAADRIKQLKKGRDDLE
jgi:cell division protein FtsB